MVKLRDKYKLTFSPKESLLVSKLTEQLYFEEMDNLPEPEEGSVTLNILYMYNVEDKFEIKVFIINSTSETVIFEEVPLLLIDIENNVVASENVNMSDAGEIPPMNIRPYSIFFSRSSFTGEQKADESFRVIINTRKLVVKGASKITIEHIDETIDLYERKLIEQYINNIPVVTTDQAKLIPYKSGIGEQGSIYCIIIVVNGWNDSVKMENFNIIFRNITGIIQAIKKIHCLPEVSAQSAAAFKVKILEEDILNQDFNPLLCEMSIETATRQ